MTPSFVSTRNPCKLCAPFGATLAFLGLEGCIPLLHGSQGCSTYIRRYMIGHFREPVDVASSNFHEQAAIFGGKSNLADAIFNVVKQYRPRVIGIATTCLAETIGDDVGMILRELSSKAGDADLPALVHASTPSYQGCDAEGYHAAIRAMVDQLADNQPGADHLALFPGMLSSEDLRYLRDLVEDFELPVIMLSDYADRLDGPTWDTFHRIPEGGTALEQLYRLGGARTCLELTSVYEPARTGGGLLADRFGVRHVRLPMPIGVKLTDRFTRELEALSGRPLPYRHAAERGRLIDSYVDAHKYVFDKRAVLFGHEDLVVSLSAFLAEVGMIPALIASGGGSAGGLRRAVLSAAPELEGHARILGGVDFAEIEEAAVQMQADLLIGSSNGYRLSRQLGVPLVRVGLPIHDRLGAARVMHVGYRGTQQLFDRIVNALLEARQDGDPTGYTHM